MFVHTKKWTKLPSIQEENTVVCPHVIIHIKCKRGPVIAQQADGHIEVVLLIVTLTRMPQFVFRPEGKKNM